jgi:hypothetical protein
MEEVIAKIEFNLKTANCQFLPLKKKGGDEVQKNITSIIN